MVRICPTLLAGAVAFAVVLVPAPASAGDDGGATAPGEDTTQREPTGGARKGSASVLTSFAVRRKRLYLYGRSARIEFTLRGRRAASVRLHVLNAADRARVATLDLGERDAGGHSLRFTGLETGAPLPEGRYLLHLAGRGVRRSPASASSAELEFRHHVFPVAGPFSWGDDGSRFGAGRKGHRHQGQDLSAAEGTPVVAPRGGDVDAVEYQARGAGHYVVLDGDGEDYDYAFMHLRADSIPVEVGEHVRTGQLIGEVGNTGRSSGPHLHFEVWAGEWFDGGTAVDPLPLLEGWAE